MARASDAASEVVDLAEVAAVCAAVVGCHDRLLVGDPTVLHELDRALCRARELRGLSGRLAWALAVVGGGATGVSPGRLAAAIETLRPAVPRACAGDP